jgi:hypothetical protein
MRSSSIIFLLCLILADCATPKQQTSLTDVQATQLATRLANDQATFLYHCQPFQVGQPANFTNGYWHWKQLRPGDYEATVELAANGSTNRVRVYWLDDSAPIPW